MADVFQVAKERAERYGVKNAIVPTMETGKTVKAAQQALGGGYRFFAVGNPDTSHEKGWCLHKGITDQKRKELEALGVTVILQDISLFQALGSGGRMLINGKSFDVWGRKTELRAPLDTVIENVGPEAKYNPVGVIAQAMNWLGEGGRVAIEVTLMAAASGKLPLDEMCIAIATPVDPGVPDACVVLWPATLEDILTGRFGVVDAAQVPKTN